MSYGLSTERVQFQKITPSIGLPFPDESFDLATCVSVLEFITEPKQRSYLGAELVRIVKPSGYIFLATPTPWRLREFHSRRFLGHFLHRDGYPWSSTPSAIAKIFASCDRIATEAFQISFGLQHRGLPAINLPSRLASPMAWCLPWQKHLFQKGNDPCWNGNTKTQLG
jgi:SAM-dependent methyltransferase